MPEPIGWALPRAGRDDLIAGFKSGVASLTLDPVTITPIVAPEADRPHNRLNDAKVDRAGRLWFGSKDDRDEQATGALYCLDTDLTLTRHGRRLLGGQRADLQPRRSLAVSYGQRKAAGVSLRAQRRCLARPRQPFINFEDEWGYPDGMTTDADGCLWIAHWAGGRISRFDPAGKLMRSIALPAINITSCAFAGPALDRLFVTSAAIDDPDSASAGALFEIEPGTTGLILPSFEG